MAFPSTNGTSNGVAGVMPKFGEFQLLGDSIFVRFANRALQQRSTNNTGTPSLGFCTSGQRINQLRRKIKNKEYVLTRKVMILIGTNDVLCGRALSTMTRHFGKLLTLLRNRSVVKMVILTLPPIPKLSLTSEHWEVVRGFNQFLLSLASPPDKIRVLDIMPLFLKYDCPILAAPPRGKRKTRSRFSVSPLKIVRLKECSLDSSDDEQENGKPLSLFCKYLNRVNRQDAMKEAESSDDDGPVNQLPLFIDYYFWSRLEEQISKLEEQGPAGYNFSPGSPCIDTPTSKYKIPLLTSPSSSPQGPAGYTFSPGSPCVDTPTPKYKIPLLTSPLSSPQGPAGYNFSPGSPCIDTPTSKYKIPLLTSPLSSTNGETEEGGSPSSKTLTETGKNILEHTNRFIRLEFYEQFYYGTRLDMIHPNATGLKTLKKFILDCEVI